MILELIGFLIKEWKRNFEGMDKIQVRKLTIP